MRTDRRMFLTSGLTLLGVAGAGAPGGRHKVSSHHVRAKVVCGLPAYGYIPDLPAPSALAVSETAVLLRSPTITPGLAAVRGATAVYYQLAQASLVNGHCAISRVALVIRDDGVWSLSLRADQNAILVEPGPLPIAASPAPPRLILPGATVPSRFTAHIKRNLFTVRVRAYGAYLAPVDPNTSPGHPVLFSLVAPPFWVERGLPLFPQFGGQDRIVAEYFQSVDRVEVELTYR